MHPPVAEEEHRLSVVQEMGGRSWACMLRGVLEIRARVASVVAAIRGDRRSGVRWVFQYRP